MSKTARATIKAHNRQTILQAITDLCAAGHAASRQAIVGATGLSMSIVDDNVRNLRDLGLIRLVVNGQFEPVDVSPDRPVSGTIVTGGRFKLEIGDHVLDLTFREARNAAALLAGQILQFGR